MASPKLKPCPFCGQAPLSDDTYAWCSTATHLISKMTHAEWNARPAESSLLAALKECEDWMLENIPANGYGLCDHAADKERREIMARARTAIREAEGGEG